MQQTPQHLDRAGICSPLQHPALTTLHGRQLSLKIESRFLSKESLIRADCRDLGGTKLSAFVLQLYYTRWHDLYVRWSALSVLRLCRLLTLRQRNSHCQHSGLGSS
jgi:hypothetical protein